MANLEFQLSFKKYRGKEEKKRIVSTEESGGDCAK